MQTCAEQTALKMKEGQHCETSDTASVVSEDEPLRRTENVLQDSSDSEEDVALVRTTTVVGAKAVQQDATDLQVKNTFIHFDDRLEEKGRTQSDPGQKMPLPPHWPQRYPSVSAVPEDREASVNEVPEPESLQRHSTYDRFSEGQLERLSTFDYFSAPGEEGLQRLSTYDHFANTALMTPYTAGGQGQAPAMTVPSFMPVMLQAMPLVPWSMAPATEIPFGQRHSFHKEVKGFGEASSDLRQFTKGSDFEGRLSVLSGSEVQRSGVQTYLAQFSGGEMSKADGIGFVFASRVPCAKNIQKIVSVFVNQRGRICMRVFGDILRAKAHVKAIKLGDWVEMTVDLDNSVATFRVWPSNPSPGAEAPRSSAEFHFGERLAQAERAVKLDVGHFACVVQNVGTTITLGS